MGEHRDIRAYYKDLIADATNVANQIRTLQLESVEIVRELNKITSKLINAAEEHLGGAIDEIEAERGQKRVKSVVYSVEDKIEVATPEGLPKGKRACSICRKTGHKAPNCPEAHLIKRG